MEVTVITVIMFSILSGAACFAAGWFLAAILGSGSEADEQSETWYDGYHAGYQMARKVRE